MEWNIGRERLLGNYGRSSGKNGVQAYERREWDKMLFEGTMAEVHFASVGWELRYERRNAFVQSYSVHYIVVINPSFIYQCDESLTQIPAYYRYVHKMDFYISIST